MIKLVECPRDAMQGLQTFIPTAQKVRYLNQLLRVGFHTLDFGSFVSPKAVPQMSDTVEVLEQLDWQKSKTRLLAIVANLRGAEEAMRHEGVTYIGFPLSISDTFQQRNTNKSVVRAMDTVKDIQELCTRHGKLQVVYISMGFGNPYGDPYSEDLVVEFTGRLKEEGIQIVSLADTVGLATPQQVTRLFGALSAAFPDIELGVHLHSRPEQVVAKVKAAVESGCRRIDGAIKGFGGCPMAQDELVGNIPTEKIIGWLEEQGMETGVNAAELVEAVRLAAEIFPKH
ncbi:MAG: hydroxymethylglutaryl-CoA lyase [Cyclobacteriaceae bacterium]|nr:MAG: hydroxymethylglutaryl-CoA lyase [Cyclobacteriaceae bacterium]